MTVSIPGAKGSIMSEDSRLTEKIIFEMVHAKEIELWMGGCLCTGVRHGDWLMQLDGTHIGTLKYKNSYLVIASYERAVSHKVKLEPSEVVFHLSSLPISFESYSSVIVRAEIDDCRSQWEEFSKSLSKGDRLMASSCSGLAQLQVVSGAFEKSIAIQLKTQR